MDFFARQEQSKRKSRQLIVLFCLAFSAVAGATAVAVVIVVGLVSNGTSSIGSFQAPGNANNALLILLAVAAGTIVLMVLASLYRSATLSRGGAQVARMLGGTEINADTSDRLHRRLINVVEEIAIASGLPVPDVFVLDQESGINAFAAGLTHSDAAVAVTQGALERLDRAELQGVIAHEFSHVLNGDMRLNQRLIGYSFGILVLSLVGRWLMRSQRFVRRGSRDRGVPVILLLGVALTVIGAIGVFFSRLIKAGVSRQREVLADASAVQFTREPSALAGALKKIGGYTASLSATESEEVAHMLFGSGSSAFRGWFATHPPIDERIRALDPSFKAKGEQGPASASTGLDFPEDAVSGFTNATTEAVVDATGHIQSAEVGGRLRSAIPEELYFSAHSRESSFLLAIAMALATTHEASQRQAEYLNQRLGADRASRCLKLHRELQELDARLRLPLLETAIPALKQRPEEQIQFLLDSVDRLLELDPEIRFFEFIVVRLLNAYLPATRRPSFKKHAADLRVKARDAGSILLAAVAGFGNDDPAQARDAYLAGMAVLHPNVSEPKIPARAAAADRTSLLLLDGALEQLAQASPTLKRLLLRSVLTTVRHDRRVEVAEIELYRAIAATLECPVPPPQIDRQDVLSRKE